jgi:transposase-like protein
LTDLDAGPGDDVVVSSSKKPAGGRTKRRSFTAEYKLQILEEYERLLREGSPGDPGALLRRENLLSSHITEWRKARKGGALQALTPKVRKPSRSPAEVELEKVRAEKEKLTKELETTKAVLEVVGKAHALLEMLSERADSENRPEK